MECDFSFRSINGDDRKVATTLIEFADYEVVYRLMLVDILGNSDIFSYDEEIFPEQIVMRGQWPEAKVRKLIRERADPEFTPSGMPIAPVRSRSIMTINTTSGNYKKVFGDPKKS